VLSLSLIALSGCKDIVASKTYNVKNWGEVQNTLDSAGSGDIFDFSQLATPTSPHSFSIPANLTLTLKGDPSVTYVGVAFYCAGGNVITLVDMNFVSTGNQALSTLHFAGKGNQLKLEGINSLVNAQAPDDVGYGAAVGVPEGVALVINGDGYLSAVGGTSAAGIGGGSFSPSGAITINSGRVDAKGGDIGEGTGAAGIGGGAGGSSESINIRGGTINAIAGYGGAAIGGGCNAAGNVISISGGTIVADGSIGNGLGAGVGGSGASITITKGNVTAIGGLVPGSEAINGQLETLPTAYQWWANQSTPISEDQQASVYPEEAFTKQSEYRYIRIKSR
jgi:hypothetical protein